MHSITIRQKKNGWELYSPRTLPLNNANHFQSFFFCFLNVQIQSAEKSCGFYCMITVLTGPAWCGYRSVSMETSRTCEGPGRGLAAWRPGTPPGHGAGHIQGAQWSSSTHTDRRSTCCPLEGGREAQFDKSVEGRCCSVHAHTTCTLIPGEVKKVLDNLRSVVSSLISVVTLISRPTTGGILLKPSSLKNKTKQK